METQTDFMTIHEDRLFQLRETLNEDPKSSKDILRQVYHQFQELKKLPFEEVRFQMRLCAEIAWQCYFHHENLLVKDGTSKNKETVCVFNIQQYYLKHRPGDREIMEQQSQLCGMANILDHEASESAHEVTFFRTKETQANLPSKNKIVPAVIQQSTGDNIDYTKNFMELEKCFKELRVLTKQDNLKNKAKKFDAFASGLTQLVYQIKMVYPLNSCQQIDMISHPALIVLNFAANTQTLYINFLKTYYEEDLQKLNLALQQRALFLRTLLSYYKKSNAPAEMIASQGERLRVAEEQSLNIKSMMSCDNIIKSPATFLNEKSRAEAELKSIKQVHMTAMEAIASSFKALFGFECLSGSPWQGLNLRYQSELSDLYANLTPQPFQPFVDKMSCYVNNMLAVMAPQNDLPDMPMPYLNLVDGNNQLDHTKPLVLSEEMLQEKEAVLLALTLYFQAKIEALQQQIHFPDSSLVIDINKIDAEIFICQTRLEMYEFLLGQKVSLAPDYIQSNIELIIASDHITPLIKALAFMEQLAITETTRTQTLDDKAQQENIEILSEVSKVSQRVKLTKRRNNKPIDTIPVKDITPDTMDKSKLTLPTHIASKHQELLNALDDDENERALVIVKEWIDLLKNEIQQNPKSADKKSDEQRLIEQTLYDAYMYQAVIQRYLSKASDSIETLEMALHYVAPESEASMTIRNMQMQRIMEYRWLVYSDCGHVGKASEAYEIAKQYAEKNDSYCFIVAYAGLTAISQIDNVDSLQTVIKRYEDLIDRVLDDNKPRIFVGHHDIPHFQFVLKSLSGYLLFDGIRMVQSGLGEGNNDLLKEGMVLINRSLGLNYALLDHSRIHDRDETFYLEVKLADAFCELQAILPPNHTNKNYKGKCYKLLAEEHYDEAKKIANHLNDPEKEKLVKRGLAKLEEATIRARRAIETSMRDIAEINFQQVCFEGILQERSEVLDIIENIPEEIDNMLLFMERHTKIEQIKNILRLLAVFHGTEFFDHREANNRKIISEFNKELDALRFNLAQKMDRSHALILNTLKARADKDSSTDIATLIDCYHVDLHYLTKVTRLYEEQKYEVKFKLGTMHVQLKEKLGFVNGMLNARLSEIEALSDKNEPLSLLTKEDCFKKQNERMMIDLTAINLGDLKSANNDRLEPFRKGITALEKTYFWIALYRFYSGLHDKQNHNALKSCRSDNGKVHLLMAKVLDWALNEIKENIYTNMKNKDSRLYLQTIFTKIKSFCLKEYKVAQDKGKGFFGKSYLMDDINKLNVLSLTSSESDDIIEQDKKEGCSVSGV